VVVDACALIPLTLCDTLLRAANANLFQLYWSAEILEETRRNLVVKIGLSEEHAARRCDSMRKHFHEALVSDYEPYINVMKTDPKDRHVAAAALKAGAQVIVTSNLRDFHNLPAGIEAQSPDDFLCTLFGLAPDRMTDLVEQQAAALKRPPITLEQVLGGLAKTVPRFAAAVRQRVCENG
jgi:predicted nucleic acid-binding protein